MLGLGVVLLAFALASGSAIPKRILSPNGRIIGGTPVKIEDNPWQISLQYSGEHSCGGSLISADTVITAAHCIGTAIYSAEIVYGSADLNGTNIKSAKIKNAVPHKDYPSFFGGHDIAIIILDEPVTFDNTTQAVKLADEEPVSGDTVRVTGWGVLNDEDGLMPTILHGVDVIAVDRDTCNKNYSMFGNDTIDETMICAGVSNGEKDACDGDSGGPLTKDGVLYGIVSWGYGCADPDYPGVYTNVANFRSWIKENSGV